MAFETKEQMEEAVKALEESGDYRIQRRLNIDHFLPRLDAKIPETEIGLYVDVETTGIEPKDDSIIELAIVPFLFKEDGTIVGYGKPYSSFSDPGCEISDEITRITGITTDMVQGHSLDSSVIKGYLQNATLVLAHKADFDRKFLDKLELGFEDKKWACSLQEIPWKENGYKSQSLENIAADNMLFYGSHRARDDCFAALALLTKPLNNGNTPFQELLKSSNNPRYYIEATKSEFGKKDLLKDRGYRWNSTKKIWWTKVASEAFDDELNWLSANIYQNNKTEAPMPINQLPIHVKQIDAKDIYSDRELLNVTRLNKPDMQPTFKF